MKTNSTSRSASFIPGVVLGFLLLFGLSVGSPAKESNALSAPTFVPGSTALHFDGATQWVSLRYWDMGTLTLESWIKLDVGGTGGPFLGRQEDLILGVVDGKAYLQLELGGGNWRVLQSQQTLASGVWYHIAGTYDKATMKIYINGQLDGELAATGVLFHDGCTAYWSIGAVYDRCSNRYFALFAGTVDEVRVWDYARTQDEILATLNTSLNGDEPGLIGYWPLDEGSGQIATDKSEHGRDGTLGSTPQEDANDPDWVSDAQAASYQDTILADNPMMYWRLGERCKTIAYDESPNHRDATYVHRPTHGLPGGIADDPDTAVGFDGINQYARWTPTSSYAGEFTMEAWVKERHVHLAETFFNTRSAAGWFGWTGFDFKFDTLAGKEIRMDVGDGTTWLSIFAVPFDFVPHVWYHVAAVVTTTGAMCYVDGLAIGSVTYTGTPILFDSTHKVEIGSCSFLDEWFDGAIDEVAVYAYALSADQIATHYSVGIGTYMASRGNFSR